MPLREGRKKNMYRMKLNAFPFKLFFGIIDYVLNYPHTGELTIS